MFTLALNEVPPSVNNRLMPVWNQRRMVQSPEDRDFQARVRKAWARAGLGAHKPLTGPVELVLRFWVTSIHRDASNMVKSIEDALTGLAWADDQQVCELRVSKRIAKKGERTELHVRELPADASLLEEYKRLAQAEKKRRRAPARQRPQVELPLATPPARPSLMRRNPPQETLLQRLNRLATPATYRRKP